MTKEKIMTFIIGGGCLIFGIVLILFWWEDVVMLFRGALSLSLALAGLFILYSIKD